MCAPFAVAAPLVGLGIKGVSSLFATHSARGQADRAQEANNKLVNDTRTAAVANTNRALQDLDARELEDMLAAAQQGDQVTRQANRDKSTAIVAAGESGVTGQSVDELLNDVQAQASRNRLTIKTNSDITQAQLQRSRDQVIAQGQSEYNSVQPQKINKPSYLSAALGISQDVIGTVDYLQNRIPPTGHDVSKAPLPMDQDY